MTFLKMLLSLLKERKKNKLIHVYEKKKIKKKKGMCKSFKFSVIGHVKNKTGK